MVDHLVRFIIPHGKAPLKPLQSHTKQNRPTPPSMTTLLETTRGWRALELFYSMAFVPENGKHTGSKWKVKQLELISGVGNWTLLHSAQAHVRLVWIGRPSVATEVLGPEHRLILRAKCWGDPKPTLDELRSFGSRLEAFTSWVCSSRSPFTPETAKERGWRNRLHSKKAGKLKMATHVSGHTCTKDGRATFQTGQQAFMGPALRFKQRGC